MTISCFFRGFFQQQKLFSSVVISPQNQRGDFETSQITAQIDGDGFQGTLSMERERERERKRERNKERENKNTRCSDLSPPPSTSHLFFSCPCSRPCLRLSRVKTKPNNPINHIKRNRKGKKPTRERKRETRTISPFSPLPHSLDAGFEETLAPASLAHRASVATPNPVAPPSPSLQAGPAMSMWAHSTPCAGSFFLGGGVEEKRGDRENGRVRKRKKGEERKNATAGERQRRTREKTLSFSLSLSYLLDKLFQEEPCGDRATVAPPGVLHVGDLRRVFFFPERISVFLF